MEQVFRILFNMSYTGALVVLILLPLRLLLKKAPRNIACALWLIPLFRFLCPVSFESAISLLPGTQPIPPEFLTAQAPQVYTGIPVLNSTVNPAISGGLAAAPYASANPAQLLLWALGWAWLIGACAIAVYAVVSLTLLKYRLRFALPVEPGVYETEAVDTAFVFGVWHPVIYLPAGLDAQSRAHVLLHERSHIRRRDYLLQPLFFLALALHWFNPLAWLMYSLFVRDMELACDESALKHAQGDIRQAYSTTLLTLCAYNRPRPALGFGQSSIKARIKSILNYKKPAFWVVTVSVVAVLSAGVLLLLNPLGKSPSVGIIGGADGPTQVYINNSNQPESTQQSAEPTMPLADSVVFYEDGLITRIVSINSEETRYFIDTVIFDHMIRSAAWPGLDMNAFPDRIDIYRSGSPAAYGLSMDVCHVFLQDGKACLQIGDGMYTYMSPELYEQLLLFGTPEFPKIVIPSPNPYEPTPDPNAPKVKPVPTDEAPGEGAVTADQTEETPKPAPAAEGAVYDAPSPKPAPPAAESADEAPLRTPAPVPQTDA